MRIVLLSAALALGAVPAWAAGSRSNTPEVFYQPANGTAFFQLSYSQFLPSASTSVTTGGIKAYDVKLASSGYDFALGYGVADWLGFTIGTGLHSDQSDFTDPNSNTWSTKASGMKDIEATLATIMQMSGWNFHFGVAGRLNAAKRMDQSTSADGNEHTGGTSLSPYIGFSVGSGTGTYYGLKATYISEMEKTANPNTAGALDYKISGGNQTQYLAFYESDADPLEYDVRLSFASFDKATSTYASGSTSVTEAFSVPQLGLGLQWQLASSVSVRVDYDARLLPEVTSGSSKIAAYMESTLGARLRFEF